MSDRDTVGVVVPAFEPDVAVLRQYVGDLRRELDPERVLVELDAPGPGVVEALAETTADVHVASARRGKGAAVTCGFERLETDVLAFADADASTPAAELARVVEACTGGRAAVAAGSRRHPEATVASHQTYGRRRLGDAFARVARGVLGVPVHDFQCGAKALTADAWRRVRPHVYESGFAWDVEVLAVAHALGLSIAEVPVEWTDRENSTVDPVRTSLDLLRALAVVRHRTAALRGSTLHRVADVPRGRPLVETDVVRE